MKNRISPWWLLSGLAAAMAAGATEVPQAGSTEVTVAGVKVGIDPATGKLRPLSSEERQQLGLAMRGSQQRVAPVHAGKKGFVMPRTEAEALATKRALPGGGTAIQLPESRMSDLIVERSADGALQIGHGDAEHGLAPVAATAEEK